MIEKAKIAALFALFLAAPAQAGAVGDSPLGLWARGDGKAQVKIEPCGAELCAINIWIKPGVKDEKVGDRLVLSIKPADGKRWAGAAFDPQRNLRFDMSFDVDGKTMQSHGCVLGGLLCKSMGWSRIDSE